MSAGLTSPHLPSTRLIDIACSASTRGILSGKVCASVAASLPPFLDATCLLDPLAPVRLLARQRYLLMPPQTCPGALRDSHGRWECFSKMIGGMVCSRVVRRLANPAWRIHNYIAAMGFSIWTRLRPLTAFAAIVDPRAVETIVGCPLRHTRALRRTGRLID